MRERLIELMRESHCVDTWDYNTDDFKDPNPIEELADHLLTNGVIVPPCKVGDYVEWETGLQLRLYRVNGFIYHTNNSVYPLRYDLDDIQPIITHCAIKRILTKEEAEAALKGGVQK